MCGQAKNLEEEVEEVDKADCLKYAVAGRVAANVDYCPALHTGLDADVAGGGDTAVELAVAVGDGIGQGVAQAVEDAANAVGGADDEHIAGAGNAGAVNAVVEGVGEVADDADAPTDTSPRAAPTMAPQSCLEVAESSLAVAQKKQAALIHSFARQPQG